MAVTIKKVAELAGVSTGTVDRALHDRGRVDAKVAQRIKQIALELDYRPNSVAKSLSNRKRRSYAMTTPTRSAWRSRTATSAPRSHNALRSRATQR